MNTERLEWKVHTPNLLGELGHISKDGLGVLTKPVFIFAQILLQVAERASQLNDLELNKLMMRLALYTVADPESPEYDYAFVHEYMERKE